MLTLTRMHVCVAAVCVFSASSIVEAQPQTAAPAAAPIAAHGAVAGETAVKSEGKSEEAKIEKAGEDDLITDRPDFTESSEVVPRGGYQFESGVSFERDVVDGVAGRNVSAPSSLMRIGLGGRTELRISTDGFQSQSVDGLRASGYSDLELGLKIRLLDQAKVGFDFALIPMASFPTGKEGFTSGHVDPTLKLTWARELPAGWGATGNFNFSSMSDEAGRFSQRAISASFGHAIAGGWEGFGELFGFTPMERGGASGVTLASGVARQIGHNLHVDVAVEHGLTAAAPDWSFGVGFAIRGLMSSWR